MIAANTDKIALEVASSMLARRTFNPGEAKAWGLIHEIKSELFEIGSEVISIQCQPPPEKNDVCGGCR